MTAEITGELSRVVLPALAVIAVVAFLWLMTFYRARVMSVGRAVRRQTAEPFNAAPQSAPEGASIVVVAGDDCVALERLLNRIFEQEFALPMEVIVVNDGKNEEVKDVVTRMKNLAHRPNLYATFTPPGLRNISNRKLALTLGVKAAKYPVIIVVGEQSRIYSAQWLGRMFEPFSRQGVELVIGSALPSAKLDSMRGNRYRSFVNGFDAVEWLSAALRGKPYRAHRVNMAFTREAFFRVGGFNGALNLRDGDDDIFVSKIVGKDNFAVVCAAQAAVRYTHPDPVRLMHDERPARIYTRGRLGRATSLFFGFSSLMIWTLVCSVGLGIALSVFLREWIYLGVFAAVLVIAWFMLAWMWRKTLVALRCRPVAMMALPRLLRRPFTNRFHRLYARVHRGEYHTWTTKK